ncbi:MAG: hypothetical protein NVV66_11500 [Cellulomonas sp.]|uniref:hypothetical protein n=1 Tax=Cellulomonas sp. TaxID=40001 RepID=UPI00258CE92B|nr:hypothetical protein [Cellulomonas sp.]MCR6705283.1 hypothetical protein [Cellulomonas sp.]
MDVLVVRVAQVSPSTAVARVPRSVRVAHTKAPATANSAIASTGSGTGESQSCTRPKTVVSVRLAASWIGVPPLMSLRHASAMTATPIRANPIATATFRLFVTRVRPATDRRTTLARTSRRSPSRALSQSNAMTKSGKTIPNT